MVKSTLMNVDRRFKEFIRLKWPKIKDPERTRRVLDSLTSQEKQNSVLRKLEEAIYGKK